MCISAIFILDTKGKVILSRNYRGDIEMNCIDRFMQTVLEEDDSKLNPIVYSGDITFIYVRHTNLILVATTNKNTNASLVLMFLFRIVKVFSEYFSEFEEESVRDNFVTIYELLDEFMDFGYPQTTDANILQEFIMQDYNQMEKKFFAPPPTGAISWRPTNIKYTKNECFLDVVESINTSINTNGNVIRSEIVGSIQMRTYLSGMPELRLGLNDKVLFQHTGRDLSKAVGLEDIKFHQCVRLSRFEHERTISFVPPDGEFELMSYRISKQDVKALFTVESKIQRYTHSRLEYMVKIKSQFKRRNTANDVKILIPVASDADGPKFKTSAGHCKYDSGKNQIVWTIKSFPGAKEYLMAAHFNLPSITSEEIESKQPIELKFEIPYFTMSGIQVRYLKIIEKSGYPAIPWIRYITKNGDYQIRAQEVVVK